MSPEYAPWFKGWKAMNKDVEDREERWGKRERRKSQSGTLSRAERARLREERGEG
jgi:hypothetical protein